MGEWDVVEAKKPSEWDVVKSTTMDEDVQNEEWAPTAPDPNIAPLFERPNRFVDGISKFADSAINALKEAASPFTSKFRPGMSTAEKVVAPAAGLIDFYKRPFTIPIPGAHALAERVKEIQPQAELDEAADAAGRSGGLTAKNFPYRKFAQRVGTEALSTLVPKNPMEVASYALPGILKGASVAEVPALNSLVKELPIVAKAGSASPVDDVASHIVRKFKGEKQPFSWDKLYQETINRFHSIEEISDMAKKGDVIIPPGQDPKYLARSYLGLTGKANTALEHKMFKMLPDGNVQFTGPGFKETIAPMADNLEDLSTYLASRRALSLGKRQIETGIPLTSAEKSVKILEAKHPAIAKVADDLQGWQDGLLNYLVDSGRIGKANYNAIKEANDFYAPMQRVFAEDPMRFNITNREIFNRVMNPVKRIEGSERKIIDPLESMVKNTFQIMDAADRNRVAQAVLNLRQKNPALKDILQVVKKPSGDTITAYYGGHPVHYKAPPELLEAMRGLSEETAGMLSKILGFPSRVLRAGATLSPEFALRNPVRDQWSAMVNSRYGFTPGYDFMRGAFSAMKADDAYWRWQASGGSQSFLVSMDRNISDLLWNPPKGYWGKYAEYAKNPLKILQDVSSGMETPTRVGVFKKASEKGASDIVAGFESREGTVDFARRGAKMKAINSIYAFFNARLQGIDKTIRTFKENPMKATVAAAPLTAASILLKLVNRGEPDYAEIPQWQKDLFWLFKVKNTWVKIPKGDLGMVFGSSAEHLMDWMEKNEPGKLAAFAFETLQSVSPVEFNKGGVIPNFARPVIENLANYNYFLKRNIVSEGKQRLLPEFQFSQYDTETAKLIGKALGVSPAKVTNMITGYGGGLARMALQGVDKAGQAAGALPEKPELPTKAIDIPGLKGFIVREPTGSSSQSVNDFYSSWETIQQTMNTIRQNPEQMDRISRKHPEWVLHRSFKKTADMLDKYRKIRDGVLESQISPQEKQEAIEKLNAQMTVLARGAQEQLYEFKKSRKK